MSILNFSGCNDKKQQILFRHSTTNDMIFIKSSLYLANEGTYQTHINKRTMYVLFHKYLTQQSMNNFKSVQNCYTNTYQNSVSKTFSYQFYYKHQHIALSAFFAFDHSHSNSIRSLDKTFFHVDFLDPCPRANS